LKTQRAARTRNAAEAPRWRRAKQLRTRHAFTPAQFIVPLCDRYIGPELSLGLDGSLGTYEHGEIDADHPVVLHEPARIAACIERLCAKHRTDHGGPAQAPLNARAADA
jgi:hypothetical protein